MQKSCARAHSTMYGFMFRGNGFVKDSKLKESPHSACRRLVQPAFFFKALKSLLNKFYPRFNT